MQTCAIDSTTSDLLDCLSRKKESTEEAISLRVTKGIWLAGVTFKYSLSNESDG